MSVFWNNGLNGYREGWYYKAPPYWLPTGAASIQGSRHNEPFKSKLAAQRAYERHQHHIYWYKIWHTAMYQNMPYRIAYKKAWVEREPGTTHLADFIRKEVRGKMKVVDNTVYEWAQGGGYSYGRQSALALLMGYNLKKGGHNAVYVNAARGSMPRDPAKRKLLLQLAGENGKELAFQMLKKLRPRFKYILNG